MKMVLKTAAVYIGLVIGAGFASGREVMEYFNIISSVNPTGILAAAFLFMLTAYMIGAKASEENISTFDEYISAVSGRAAPFVKYFMLAYMFCGMFVMFSGSGALLYETTAYSSVWGAAAMAAVCFLVISFDLSGVVTLNLVLVPLMIFGICGVCVYSAVFGDVSTFVSFENTGAAVTSAICYASYNTLTSGAVLVPLAHSQKIKDVRRSAVLGGFVIGLLITMVWTVQGASFDMLWDSELPMLTLAAMCGKQCKRLYWAVLVMAICTTAVSYGFGIMSHFSDRIKTVKDRVLFAAVVCLAALPPAFYGFSALVSKLYSLFGYIGIAWIIWIITDRIRG